MQVKVKMKKKEEEVKMTVETPSSDTRGSFISLTEYDG